MPIEIKELHIKATVGSAPSGTGGADTTAKGGNDAQQEAIVAACVEKVLQILEDKKAR